VAVFQLINGTATAVDDQSVTVSQEADEQSFDVTVVGAANSVELAVTEDIIASNGSTSNVEDCQSDTDVTDAIDPPTSSLAYAAAFDADDTLLTRIPVTLSIDPPGDDPDIAALGQGSIDEGVTGNTFFTLQPTQENAPVGFYQVVCGGTGTGTTEVLAEIGGGIDSARDEITVVGAAGAVALAAAPTGIVCDGVTSSTVTATVTDTNGDPVANGVPVTFEVVALGTANPIQAVTTGATGTASSTITPLSSAGAGVTVVVTAGDADIATPVQASLLVNCTGFLAATATAVAGAPTPTPGTGTIAPPDTGTGGYLNQNDSAGLPLWTIAAIALGSMTLVAGGLVARRAGK
jgi:adhesin/invasin